MVGRRALVRTEEKTLELLRTWIRASFGLLADVVRKSELQDLRLREQPETTRTLTRIGNRACPAADAATERRSHARPGKEPDV